MSVACLHIPQFGMRVATLARPTLAGQPLILRDDRPTVRDASPAAQRHGVRLGLSLREAMARCPEALVLAPDPAAEHEQLHAITTVLASISPLVEPSSREPGTWYVDLTGLDRHFGSIREAGTYILQQAPAHLQPRAGIAISKFAARVAAEQGASGDVAIVPPAQTTTLLANAPIELLPLSTTAHHELNRMGIVTLGHYTALPRAKIGARFGPSGQHAWDLIHGTALDPVTPPARSLTVSAHLALPAPATTRDVVLVALGQLVHQAFQSPDLLSRQAREITIRAGLDHDRSWERTLVFKSAYGPNRLIRALKLRLQHLVLPGPVDTLTIELQGIVPTSSYQAMLPALRPRQHLTSLSHAVAMLTQRYGQSPLYRIVEVEPWSRIPEPRHALIRFAP